MEGVMEGRIVHYVLTDNDALQINRRRVDDAWLSEKWSEGA